MPGARVEGGGRVEGSAWLQNLKAGVTTRPPPEAASDIALRRDAPENGYAVEAPGLLVCSNKHS